MVQRGGIELSFPCTTEKFDCYPWQLINYRKCNFAFKMCLFPKASSPPLPREKERMDNATVEEGSITIEASVSAPGSWERVLSHKHSPSHILNKPHKTKQQ